MVKNSALIHINVWFVRIGSVVVGTQGPYTGESYDTDGQLIWRNITRPSCLTLSLWLLNGYYLQDY